MSVRKCHTFVPNLRAIQQDSSHHSTHHNSSHRSIHRNSSHFSKKDQSYRRMPIPECPSLSPIASFQDLRDQFSMFCVCVSLWHLGSHFWFRWISPCFLYSMAHSWTMTCSVCLCQTIACQRSCLHRSLVENVLHRTSNTQHAKRMVLFLCQTKES